VPRKLVSEAVGEVGDERGYAKTNTATTGCFDPLALGGATNTLVASTTKKREDKPSTMQGCFV
jgi:hypothetical protein